MRHIQTAIGSFSFVCYAVALWQFGVGVYYFVSNGGFPKSHDFFNPDSLFWDTLLFTLMGLLNQKLKSRIAAVISSLFLLVTAIGCYGIIYTNNHGHGIDEYSKGDLAYIPWVGVVLFVLSVRAAIAIFKYRKDVGYLKKRREQK